ncbi:conserved hypothetical protein [Cupriavidus taiwanensis]|uniref:Antitoxin Xre/MbcA/ParS-like toxin-binding domain-containing protein n=1 Tax=Cupriavidus taiwanensis TaxID=164546 RepID=A0A975WP12_9BURK|nr:hypothetical protein [Cupriavidus taiwanensis]SOY40005.1 conserved hypothetical protein [Cupriavidus taiwanensis]
MTPAATIEAHVVPLNTEAEDALRSAVGAAAMLGPKKAKALLALPDEQLGRLFKLGISQVIDLAGLVMFGREAPPTSNMKRSRRGKTAASHTAESSYPFDFKRGAVPERQALVDSGKLLPAAKVWEVLDVTRQALNKAVASGRIFTVDVGAVQYYPAFYLTDDVDRKTLAKVTQLLGSLPGWSKWQFFTTPKASLGNITPLKALSRGKVEQVAKAAAAFAGR